MKALSLLVAVTLREEALGLAGEARAGLAPAGRKSVGKSPKGEWLTRGTSVLFFGSLYTKLPRLTRFLMWSSIIRLAAAVLRPSTPIVAMV